MKKNLILLLVLVFAGTTAFAEVGTKTKGPFGYNLYDDINRPAKQEAPQVAPETPAKTETSTAKKNVTSYGTTESAKSSGSSSVSANSSSAPWESDVIYYPNATMKSAVNKYKNGNFSGSLQELISLTKMDSANPLVYYYLGMAYTQVGNSDAAIQAYERVLVLSPDKTLMQYATKGRDCLTNGPTCAAEQDESQSEMDDFINSPYGNGFSEALNKEIRAKQLKDIQKTINNKENLEDTDIEKIHNYDNQSGSAEETIKIAQASDEDILNAIKTLKEAGVNVSINTTQNPIPNQYNDISMMLGTSNNNNNSMMNMMIPYMINQNENGQNIDPQVMQAMMMNSMLPDFTFSDNDKRY